MSCYDVPDHLYYSPTHLWVRIEGNRATIGMTDYAQIEAGMILYAELPELHECITAQGYLGSVETIDQTIELYSPITGTVVAINKLLEKEALRINNSPYDHGWVCVMEMAHIHELNSLWNADVYKQNYS